VNYLIPVTRCFVICHARIIVFLLNQIKMTQKSDEAPFEHVFFVFLKILTRSFAIIPEPLAPENNFSRRVSFSDRFRSQLDRVINRIRHLKRLLLSKWLVVMSENTNICWCIPNRNISDNQQIVDKLSYLPTKSQVFFFNCQNKIKLFF